MPDHILQDKELSNSAYSHLMIQHYIGEVVTPALCRMVSTSDAFTPNGRTVVQVIWTLSVKHMDDQSREYTNSVVAHPTAEFMEFIAKHSSSRGEGSSFFGSWTSLKCSIT